MTTEIQMDLMQSYQTTFREDGVIVFRDQVSLDHIEQLKNEINAIRDIVMRKISEMKRPLKKYSDIAERHLNRLDYRCGFTADIFSHVAAPIHQLIKKFSPHIDFRHYWGAIPSLSGAGPTDLHRDVYPFLNTTPGIDLQSHEINLPPYYFTVLIPLLAITQENGPTEFIKKSHQKTLVNPAAEKIFAPLLSAGDVIIFDGRLLHRGGANHSNQERLIAYITYVANWYHDQTFALDDYLFPELIK